MITNWEKIPVDSGMMRLFMALPEGVGPFPALVVIQHQEGVDEFVQDMTIRLASAGYGGVAPDLYHRDGPDCRDEPSTRRKRLRDANVNADVNATVDFLKTHGSLDASRIGIIGFCMGGRVAYRMASANASFKAAVCYYGGNIVQPWGEGPSPFDLTPGIHCPIQGHFGAEDRNPSPEDMRKLDAALSRYGKAHEFHSYTQAGHTFMDQGSTGYSRQADEASWPRTLDFFQRHLQGSASPGP